VTESARIKRLEDTLQVLIGLLCLEDALQPWVVRRLEELSSELALSPASEASAPSQAEGERK